VTNPAKRKEEALYEIRVRGLLDESWSDWLDGLAITQGDDGNTMLTGPIRDQCALHGLLVKIRDLGLPLLSVEQLDPDGGKDEC
jgi:hypothetical protein